MKRYVKSSDQLSLEKDVIISYIKSAYKTDDTELMASALDSLPDNTQITASLSNTAGKKFIVSINKTNDTFYQITADYAGQTHSNTFDVQDTSRLLIHELWLKAHSSNIQRRQYVSLHYDIVTPSDAMQFTVYFD